MSRVVAGPFSEALQRVRSAMKAEGFGTLTEVDVQQTLKEKIDVDVAPYTILGVCNPNLANKAIGLEPKVGVFLPCSVVVREDQGTIRIDAMDPGLMKQFISNAELEPIAAEARERMVRALDALAP